MGNENDVVVVLPNKDFRDQEYAETTRLLHEYSIGYKVVAIMPGECFGVGGTEVATDIEVDEIDPNSFAGVIFIGGPGVESSLRDEKLMNLAKAFNSAGKIVAGICWAVSILANAGVLNGKKVTAWSGCQSDLEKGGALYTGEPITVHQNIITANGPDSADAFGEKIAQTIAG
ncbi:MAG: DJ-1/PfpI family protein [Patescibacteria group bacterium]